MQLQFRSKVALQLRLDRCMSDTASELARKMNAIEQGNFFIRAAKIAGAAAAIPSYGESLEIAREVCDLIALKQDAEILDWEIMQGKWLVRRGCDGKRDWVWPLPSMGWTRGSPDAMGAAALTRENPNSDFNLRLWHGTTTSFAKVEAEKGSNETLDAIAFKSRWKANWSIGPGLL